MTTPPKTNNSIIDRRTRMLEAIFDDEFELSGVQFKINCINPACDDSTHNLEINLEGGMFHCWKCGYSGYITTLLKHIKNNNIAVDVDKYVTAEELTRYQPDDQPVDFEEPEKSEPEEPEEPNFDGIDPSNPVATYEYRSINGDLLCQKLKYLPKRFMWRRPNGKCGWIWNRKGISMVPYHLPELLHGGNLVFVCESEKDVDSLEALGITASTSGGAESWKDEFKMWFHDKDVIILPHNDSAGINYANQVSRSLQGVAKTVKVAELPGRPDDGGDITDFLHLPQRAGLTKEQFLEVVNEVAENCKDRPQDNYNFICGKELITMESPEKKWIWDGIFPADGLGLTLAKPKVGKTTFDFNFGVSVSRGSTFLGRATKQGTVLFLALQENKEEVEKYMKNMDAGKEDPEFFSNIFFHFGMAPKEAFQKLVKEMEERKPILVIIEMLQNFMRLKKIDDYAEITTKLEPIMDAAHRLGCFVLLSHHSPKLERELVDSALGSTGLVGSVDTAILIKKDRNGRRSFSSIQRYRKPGTPDVENLVLNLCKDEITLELGGLVWEEDTRKMKDEIIKVLSNIGPDKFFTGPMTEEEIRGQIKKSKEETLALLRMLYHEGRIVRVGSGVKNNPHKYSVERIR